MFTDVIIWCLMRPLYTGSFAVHWWSWNARVNLSPVCSRSFKHSMM